MKKETLYKELYDLAKAYEPVYREYANLVDTNQPYVEIEKEINKMIKKSVEIKRQIEELN